ncbi:MAG: hypothetical protein ACKVQA_26420 [Burkholderiales bacterium]
MTRSKLPHRKDPYDVIEVELADVEGVTPPRLPSTATASSAATTTPRRDTARSLDTAASAREAPPPRPRDTARSLSTAESAGEAPPPRPRETARGEARAEASPAGSRGAEAHPAAVAAATAGGRSKPSKSTPEPRKKSKAPSKSKSKQPAAPQGRGVLAGAAAEMTLLCRFCGWMGLTIDFEDHFKRAHPQEGMTDEEESAVAVFRRAMAVGKPSSGV